MKQKKNYNDGHYRKDPKFQRKCIYHRKPSWALIRNFPEIYYCICLGDGYPWTCKKNSSVAIYPDFSLYPLWEVAALKNDKEIDNELAQMVDWR